MSAQKVVIVGASENPERYSYKALHMLQEYHHIPLPVHPKLKVIEGVKVFADLDQIPRPVDTLTMYVRPEISNAMLEAILKINPVRVIFNPGSENSALQKKLAAEGIETIEACTLVMLRTHQF